MTHLHRLREWLLCGLLSRGHLPSPPSSTGSSCLRCGRVLVRFHESQPPALSWFEWADPLSQSEADAWVAAFEASRREWVRVSADPTSHYRAARASASASAATEPASR